MAVGVDEAWNNDLVGSIDNVDLSTWRNYLRFDLGNTILHDEDVVGADEGLVTIVEESHESTIAYEFGPV